MHTILLSRKKGILIIIVGFAVLFSCLVFLPKLFSSIASELDLRERSTVPVNLSREEQQKAIKEIQDLSAQLNADPTPQGADLAKLHRDIASRYVSLGRLGGAVRQYDKALDAQKTDTSALIEKGVVLGKIGSLSEGEEVIKKAIEFEPTRASHYSSLAHYYLDFGHDNENARGTYIEGLIRTNNDTELMREFASFLESIGDLSEAYLYWIELAKKLPQDTIVQGRIKALEPKNPK